jgi:drug/metabolite transporter (DMT)-like permease
MSNQDSEASFWMLCGAFCFALMGAATHALGARCDWLVVAFVRAVFMFGIAVTMARLAGARLVVWQPRTLWVRSLAGSFSLVCNFYALSRLPVADALTLSNSYPLWIVLLSALLARRWPAAWELLGVALGLVGVALIEQPKLRGESVAVGVALISAVSTSVALLGLHRLRTVDMRAILAHFAGIGALVSGVGLALRWPSIQGERYDGLTLVLLLAVAVSGTAGQFCLTRAYSLGRPARLAIVGLSQIVFALGFDIIIWKRSLDLLMILGMLLVVAPSAWLGTVSGRAAAKLATVSEPDRTQGAEAPSVPP